MAEKGQADRTSTHLPPPSPGTEVNFPVIIKIAIALVILAVIVHLFLWWLFFQLKAREALQDQALSPVANRGQQVPPWPRLQVSEPKGLEEMRQKEDAVLNEYGWVDKKAGIARVPVNEAVKLYLQQQGGGGK